MAPVESFYFSFSAFTQEKGRKGVFRSFIKPTWKRNSVFKIRGSVSGLEVCPILGKFCSEPELCFHIARNPWLLFLKWLNNWSDMFLTRQRPHYQLHFHYPMHITDVQMWNVAACLPSFHTRSFSFLLSESMLNLLLPDIDISEDII